MEAHYKHEADTNTTNSDYGYILEGHLIGDSKQVPSLLPRIVTLFQITKVHYSGKDTSIKEGQQILVSEPYHFITEETEELDWLKKGTIIAEEYYPMERKKTYVIFGAYYPGYESEDIEEFRTPWLSVIEPAYCLTDDSPQDKVNRVGYQKIWKNVKIKYSNSQPVES